MLWNVCERECKVVFVIQSVLCHENVLGFGPSSPETGLKVQSGTRGASVLKPTTASLGRSAFSVLRHYVCQSCAYVICVVNVIHVSSSCFSFNL